jgi:hypothetical protein
LGGLAKATTLGSAPVPAAAGSEPAPTTAAWASPCADAATADVPAWHANVKATSTLLAPIKLFRVADVVQAMRTALNSRIAAGMHLGAAFS